MRLRKGFFSSGSKLTGSLNLASVLRSIACRGVCSLHSPVFTFHPSQRKNITGAAR